MGACDGNQEYQSNDYAIGWKEGLLCQEIEKGCEAGCRIGILC